MLKSDFLFYLLESSAGLAVFYGFYWLALRQSTFYRVNRVYLLVTTMITLAIPVIPFGQPVPTEANSPLPTIDWAQLPKVVGKVQTRLSEQPGLLDYLFWIYLAGTLIAGIRFGKHLWSLTSYIRRSDFRKNPGYWQADTAGKLPTFSFLHFLFWDRSQGLSPAAATAVLQHELTHIREKHSWDILYLECLQIGFWFNPFVYLYKLALQHQHEFRADEVAATQWNSNAYQQLMVHNLLAQLHLPLVQSFHQSSLQQRLVMLRQPASPKSRLLMLLLLVPLTGLLAFACKEDLLPVSSIPVMTPIAARNPIEITDKVKTSETKPQIVIMSHFGNQAQPMDLRKGLSLKRFPDAISLVVMVDSTLAKNHPEEGRYNVDTYEIILVKGRRPVLPATKVQVKELNEVINITDIKKAAQPGDHLIVEVKHVIQLNAKNQIVDVNDLAGVFSIGIAE